MGRATIVGGGQAGLYTIAIDKGEAVRTARLNALQLELSRLQTVIEPEQVAKISEAGAAVTAQRAVVDQAAAEYRSGQQPTMSEIYAARSALEAVLAEAVPYRREAARYAKQRALFAEQVATLKAQKEALEVARALATIELAKLIEQGAPSGTIAAKEAEIASIKASIADVEELIDVADYNVRRIDTLIGSETPSIVYYEDQIFLTQRRIDEAEAELEDAQAAGNADAIAALESELAELATILETAENNKQLIEDYPEMFDQPSLRSILSDLSSREAAARSALAAAEENHERALAELEKTRLAAWADETDKLQDLTLKLEALRRGLFGVLARRAEVEASITYWQGLSLTDTRQAWCADRTENASGTVATIEIPGEPAAVLVAPGGRAPIAADGRLLAREAMSPAQAFWNAAVLPGWQKFKPTYRAATITALNVAANTATVALSAATSTAQGLPVNQSATLSGVPVVYSTCNAQAFQVGDAVVVEFHGQDWSAPRVIGFISNPRACTPPAPTFAPQFADTVDLATDVIDMLDGSWLFYSRAAQLDIPGFPANNVIRNVFGAFNSGLQISVTMDGLTGDLNSPADPSAPAQFYFTVTRFSGSGQIRVRLYYLRYFSDQASAESHQPSGISYAGTYDGYSVTCSYSFSARAPYQAGASTFTLDTYARNGSPVITTP